MAEYRLTDDVVCPMCGAQPSLPCVDALTGLQLPSSDNVPRVHPERNRIV